MAQSLFPIEHFELDLTNHCNLRCEYCFHYKELDAEKGFMPTPLALRIVDELADKGLATAFATAIFGEALLHRDFFTIAEHAQKRGLAVTLNTNGILLEERIAKKVMELAPAKLIISLNTPDSKSLPIKHAAQSFTLERYAERIEEAIRLKFALGSPTEIYLYVFNTYFAQPRGLDVVSDDESARSAARFWIERCSRVAAATGATLRFDEQRDGLEHLVGRKWPIDRGITLLDGVELVFKEAHYWGNRMLPETLEAVPTTVGHCPLPWQMLAVHWNGDCSICCLDYNRELVIGNANQQSIEDIFRGEQLTTIRSAFEQGRVAEALCQVCLGGLRDKATGAMVKDPHTSRTARVRNFVRKYGVAESVRHAVSRAVGR